MLKFIVDYLNSKCFYMIYYSKNTALDDAAMEIIDNYNYWILIYSTFKDKWLFLIIMKLEVSNF